MGRRAARRFSKRKLAIEAISGVPVLYKTGSLVIILVALLQVIAVNGGSSKIIASTRVVIPSKQESAGLPASPLEASVNMPDQMGMGYTTEFILS